MIIEKKIILEQSDFDILHDVILEVSEKSRSNEEIEKIWQNLPEGIRLQAEQWGVGDTVVRDNIYEFLKKENKS